MTMRRILILLAVLSLIICSTAIAQKNLRGAQRGQPTGSGDPLRPSSGGAGGPGGADVTAPTITSPYAVIPGNGTSLYCYFSEIIKYGAGGSATWAIDMNGTTGEGLTGTSGNGTQTLIFSITGRTILAAEGGNVTFTQPGNGWEDRAGNDLASFSKKVTNNSTQTNAAWYYPASATATSDSATTSVGWGHNVYCYGGRIQAGATGTATAIAVKLSPLADVGAKIGLYSDAGNLITQCTTTTGTGTNWRSCTISQAVTSGTYYKVVYSSETNDGLMRYTTTGTGWGAECTYANSMCASPVFGEDDEGKNYAARLCVGGDCTP